MTSEMELAKYRELVQTLEEAITLLKAALPYLWDDSDPELYYRIAHFLGVE